jgi:hypothetical protein
MLAALSGGTNNLRAQITDPEREILQEFFRATAGPTWNRKEAWGSSASVCEWEGVLCGDVDPVGPTRKVVTKLELYDNNLEGVVPASLAKLEHLRVLGLAKNRLTGEFPKELIARADANVLELHLWGNAFSGMLTRVAIQVDSAYGLCVPDLELRLSVDIDGPRGRAIPCDKLKWTDR